MNFLNQTHEFNYNIAMLEAKADNSDFYRTSLFYILTGSSELNNKIRSIYNFKADGINPDCQKTLNLSTSGKALVNLAFNLYNSNNEADVSESFQSLDFDNYKLAINALNIRFN